MIEYKLKPINIETDNVETLQIPDKKERVIEKTGHTDSFTMNDIENHIKSREKTFKELVAKRDYENAKIINIEHFHPFVKDISEEDLHTVQMYSEAKSLVNLLDSKIIEFKEQKEKDEQEIDEIIKQIPELKTSPIIEETLEIINE